MTQLIIHTPYLHPTHALYTPYVTYTLYTLLIYRYVKMDGMANRALAAVRTGEMAILPARFEKTWNNWLENIRLGLGQHGCMFTVTV